MKNLVKSILKKIVPITARMFVRRQAAWARDHLNKLCMALGIARNLQTTVPARFKVGMAVLCHERPEYLEVCLDTLFATNIDNYDITFLLIDDGSTDSRVEEIINKPRASKYKIKRVFTPKGHDSWGAAFNKAIRHLKQIDAFDIIGTCDSDALFHPEWLDKTLMIALWAKKNHRYHVLGPFSSFNSSDADFHQVQGSYATPDGKFVVKKRMGALNYFYFMDDLEKLGLFAEDKDDETLMTHIFETLKVHNFCTEVSYVEHIGELSVLNQWRPTPVARAVYGLNLVPDGWPACLEQICTFGFLRFVQKSRTFGGAKSSNIPTEVIIVATDKDLPTLPLAIDAVRKNLGHPITVLRIIAPDSAAIIELCTIKNCTFVSESSVLMFTRSDIKFVHNNVDRSGWLFQQFLKLGADAICQQEHYFVIDADTILVAPQIFETDGQLLLLHSDEYHRPYFDINRRLLETIEVTLFSCVAHQMFFSVERLKELRRHLEQTHQKPWFQCITDLLDYTEASCFSEFELYGQWSLHMYPESTVREYWRNLALSRKQLGQLEEMEHQYGQQYRSVSFHCYMSN
jgi:hypothetical protein